MVRYIAAILLLGAAQIPAQTTVTELRLRVEPESRVIRPQETALVQVLVYGSITDSRTGTQSGRLQRDGWSAGIVEPGGGWLSKPFKYQGTDSIEYLQTNTSSLGQLLGRNVGQYTIKDSVLYTAPEAPGKYTITFELLGKKVDVQLEVSASAPTARVEEKQTFAAEQPGSDPYRRLAEHYAPFVAQETWFQPKADFLARFDYDGDWRGENNWENLDRGSSQAYVHYAAMETATHVFLHYNFFHPRDYSDNCVAGSCHENDNEGIILTVQKDGSEFGRLQVMETLAHNNVYTYSNDGSLRNGLHDIDGAILFWKDSHPMVFLESGGHGAHSAGDRRSLYSVEKSQFANTGVTYIYKGAAERPRSATDREVGYDLLPIYDQWWLKSSSTDWREPTFDEYFEYLPFGGRPRMKNPRISGAFLGRNQAANKARPFWGWFDMRGRKERVTNSGQWALDPAYSISKHVLFPRQQKFALTYTFNPYLDIAPEGPRASMAAPEGFVAATPMPQGGPTPAATPAVLPTGTEAVRAAGAAALGQVLAGGENSPIGGALQRMGIGAGGVEALRGVLGGAAAGASTGECSLSATVTAPADLVIREAQTDTVAGITPKLQCATPLPHSAVTVRVEPKAAPAAVTITEQPTSENNFALKLNFSQAGSYELVLRW